MADSDESMASKTEDWIVTQIQAIQYKEAALFENAEVSPWPGTLAENVAGVVKEILAGRRAIARVRYRNDTVMQLEGGEQHHDALYDVFAAIQNDRPAAARRGDGTKIGTNGLRDLLYAALDDQEPDVTANGRYAGMTRWGGSAVAVNTKGAAILYCTLMVREVPVAS